MRKKTTRKSTLVFVLDSGPPIRAFTDFTKVIR